MNESKQKPSVNLSLGIVLIVLGIAYLVSNVFGLGGLISHLIWPMFVIGPGLALFVLMAVTGRSRGWLAVPASVVTTVGLLLFYTNLFNNWESWAYLWTLLFGSAGLGILISHYWSGKPQNTNSAIFIVKASLVAFVGFGLFFELLIFTQRGFLGKLLWPAMLIVAGGYLLLRGRDGTLISRPAPRKVRSAAKNKQTEFEPLRTGKDVESAVESKEDR